MNRTTFQFAVASNPRSRSVSVGINYKTIYLRDAPQRQNTRGVKSATVGVSNFMYSKARGRCGKSKIIY